jgi:hypothetical protein
MKPAAGFKTESRGGIELTVGASLGLDQVARRFEPPGIVVQRSSGCTASTSDISAIVNATTVRELLLNGRSWIN